MIGCTSATFSTRKIPRRNLLGQDVRRQWAGLRNTADVPGRSRQEKNSIRAHAPSQPRTVRGGDRVKCGKGKRTMITMLAPASKARKPRQLSGDSRLRIPVRFAVLGLSRRKQSASRNAPRQNRVASGGGTYHSSDCHSLIHSSRRSQGVRRHAARTIAQGSLRLIRLRPPLSEPTSPVTDTVVAKPPTSFRPSA